MFVILLECFNFKSMFFNQAFELIKKRGSKHLILPVWFNSHASDLSHVQIWTIHLADPLRHRWCHHRALWWRWNGRVVFLFQLACPEVNWAWLNTVMSQTELLWPVLTQCNVCPTPCWLCTDISNKSDIHSLTGYLDILQLVWCGVVLCEGFRAATWKPSHNMDSVVSLVQHSSRFTGLSFICRSHAASAKFKRN